MNRSTKWNPVATWVVALSFLIAMFGGGAFTGFTGHALAQDAVTGADDGICQLLKPVVDNSGQTPAYYIYNIDEDDNGYNTTLPKHDLWRVEFNATNHIDAYLGVGIPTVSVFRGPKSDPNDTRVVNMYGSMFAGESNGDCKLYDMQTDAMNYASARAVKGHSGVVVNWDTGQVMLVINNPDNRVHKVTRDQVPALLAALNNADTTKGETNLFEGIKLTWADTGEVINLPSSNGITITGNGANTSNTTSVEAPGTGTSSSTTEGGSAALQSTQTCSVSSPKRLSDLDGSPGVAPVNPAPDSYLVIDAWSNQWPHNLSPQKRDGATKEELSYDTYALFVRPGDSRWDELWGLKGAVYAWPKECEAQAVMDFNSKPSVRRITVDAYIKWVQDGTWPTTGAKAHVKDTNA